MKCRVASRKSTLKSFYISTRKEFDRLVQRAKRIHWFNIQTELLREAENNDVEFWKSIGKVGIAQTGDNRIPKEVVLDGGRVDSNLETVLQKWKTDFCSLYNRSTTNRESVCNTSDPMANTRIENQILDSKISILEIRKAIFNAERNKSPGLDEIPPDIFCNDSAVSFLHILFNVCFRSSMMSSD